MSSADFALRMLNINAYGSRIATLILLQDPASLKKKTYPNFLKKTGFD